MILKLFSSMTFLAVHHFFTTCFFYWFDIISCFPERTIRGLVFKFIGISSKVLDIMCINAFVSLMLTCMWAPNSLIVIHKEMSILRNEVYKLNSYLTWTMGERTKAFVITLFYIGRVLIAKLAFISAGVIQLLNFIMWKFAFVS